MLLTLGIDASVDSFDTGTLNTEPYYVNGASSSHLPVLRCNDTWQSAAPLAGYSGNSFSIDAPSNFDDLSLANTPSISSHMEILNISFSNMGMAGTLLHEPLLGRDLQCQTSSLGVSTWCMLGEVNENLKFSKLGSLGNCIWQNRNYTHKQLENHKQDCTCNQNIGGHSFDGPIEFWNFLSHPMMRCWAVIC